MATTNTTTTTARKGKGKRQAPAPQAPHGAGTVATTKAAQGTRQQQAQAPQAPLFTVNPLVHKPGGWANVQAVRPGTHRAYAQQVFTALAKANPKGFTLAQAKAALVQQAAHSSIAPPRGGWAAHNMPTWCANPKQAWLVPVGSK